MSDLEFWVHLLLDKVYISPLNYHPINNVLPKLLIVIMFPSKLQKHCQ
jgi:hypothetical protein